MRMQSEKIEKRFGEGGRANSRASKQGNDDRRLRTWDIVRAKRRQ